MSILVFEVSNMDSPTAMSVGAEVWTAAPYLISAEMHSTLGNSPSWIDAKFAITSPAPFPWTRMRATDKIDGVVVAIWRFALIKKSFSGQAMVWEAIGRDALYGVQDNSLRPPTRYLKPGGVDPDPAYTEWPTVVDTANAADFEESAFPTAAEKVGPNYMNKAAKRGWIIKDMTRFSAGYASSPSRPIIAVYNRGKDIIPEGTTQPLGEAAEGEILRSNFSQAQGDSANQLIRDVTKSWPWTAQEGVGIGYDYRAVWPGKVDPFAVSGQAMELFPRGSQVGGIPCIDFPVPCPACPHPPIDGCLCPPTPSESCISTVEVTTHWTRPTPVRDIIVGGIVSVILNLDRSVDRCVASAFGGGNCPTQDELDSNGSGGDIPTACGVYLIQRATNPHNGSMSLTSSLTEIPTPAEVCSAVSLSLDPFTDYVIGPNAIRNSFWTVGAEPWTCETTTRPHVNFVYIKLYAGTLQATDCAGDGDDYWVEIGSGATTCAGSPTLYYSVSVPSSLCYLENGGASLNDVIQAFADGGSRQILDNAICSATGLPPTTTLSDTPTEPITLHPCIPPISVEVTADNMSIYSRSRAMGMGSNNANDTTTAVVTHMEDTWNPTAGQYFVKREVLANDYGINDAHELDNLARSYLLAKTNAQHGYITLLVTLAGFLKAITGPFLTKPLQAGDSVDIGGGISLAFDIEAGPYIVDNIIYTWPADISKLTVSQRPASLTDAPGAGNIRNLGMASAGEGEIFESDWIEHMIFDRTPGSGFPCVTIQHNMGVIPTKILIVAAKNRIQNWYDTLEVDAAEPLFVTPAFFDTTTNQWVGYRVVSSDENRLVVAIAEQIATRAIPSGQKPLFSTDHYFKVFLNV